MIERRCETLPKNIKRRGEDEIRSLAEAALTQLNLPKNVAKGGWKEETDWGEIYRKLVEFEYKLLDEVLELYEVVRKYYFNPSLETRQRVREEAGDVVNVVMMLADKCKALKICPSCSRLIQEVHPGGVCFDCFRKWDP